MAISDYLAIIALLLACVSLGWNIYRDIVLKARLRVTMFIGSIFNPDIEDYCYSDSGERNITIDVTNFGPGVNEVQSVVMRKGWFRNQQYGFVHHDGFLKPDSPLPARLEVANSVRITIPFQVDFCFLSAEPKDIGVVDAFGRYHWAPRKQVREAVRKFSELKNT
ncbi:MAG: hypothetical protein AAF585_00435 [Verrucomicrobiota bacterium]